MLAELLHALSFAFGMLWQILWALILGFTLSGAVQAVVSKGELRRLLPDDSPRTLTVAAGLGAASSSCSYAAVALARSLFRKGANFTAATVFELASTNLVVELGDHHDPVAGVAVHARRVRRRAADDRAAGPRVPRTSLAPPGRRRARTGRSGRARKDGGPRRDGHVGAGDGAALARLTSPEGFTATANHFVMDWAAVWIDVFGGLLIAGALAAWVPETWWQSLFFESHATLATFWGPLIGPAVAVVSFVCSIGNVPLAAVLWNGGISFGGVLAFIFADLIILPILDIYRKYYGWKMAGFLLGSLYSTMAGASLLVELGFKALGLIPSERNAKVVEASVTLDYTTVLNVIFLALAASLLWRYFRRGGGVAMLRMMGKP